ncbi:kelch-like protein 38 [Amphiura filiformis]|uniref:kelch-like protein 38 n=1 Tax=Amphiura filiformis TaxID=82378 RepID=UPI003B2169E0
MAVNNPRSHLHTVLDMFRRPPKNEAMDHSYASQLSQALNDLREENQLCDIIINVGGRAFNAHKAVLAASSSYYKAMFTSGFKESTEKEISIEGNPDVFKVLIDFAYTGVLKMSPKTAFDVLDMACYMQFTHVYKTCTSIIKGYLKVNKKNQIPPDDAFKIYLLAKNHDHLEQLAKTAVEYMEDNVEGMKRSDVFLQNANTSFLENFLCREELATCHADEEKQVLELVINWLKQDWETRHTHAHSLLSKVRLGLVTPEHLTELITKDILEMPECKALVDEVLQLRTSSQSVTTLSLKSPQLFATRSTITAPITTDSGGAFSIESHVNYSTTTPTQQRWKYLNRLSPLPYSGCNQSLIVVNGRLYAAGGFDEHGEPDSDHWFHGSHSDDDSDRSIPVSKDHFYRYNAAKNRWSQLCGMIVARNSFPMVHLDGYIYAIGGLDESEIVISDVERYDLKKEEWQMLPQLPERCTNLSALAFKGKIIVHGTTPVADNPYSSLVKYVLQVYHPKSKYWQIHSEVHEVGRTLLPIPTSICI